jgi:fido (protein-threonine AMPylation protein)
MWLEHAKLPLDPDSFVNVLCSLHEQMFRDVPIFRGSVRREDVSFGGEGSHRLTGAAPDDIERLLRELCTRLGTDLHSLTGTASQDLDRQRRSLSRVCARFLEEFFRIHPFADGNGRIGRLLIWKVCLGFGYAFNLQRATATGSDRTSYIKALQHAHQHAPKSEHPHKHVHGDYLSVLSRWIYKHLERIESSEAAPNPSEE